MKKFIAALMLLTAAGNIHATDKKITDLTLLPAASFTTNDVLAIVDVGASETKKTRILDFDARYLANPLTTNGDLITQAAGISARIPIGSANTVLLSDGSSASWNSVTNAYISNTAAIADTKLGTIATAGKVSNAATTAASTNTASAIVARDGSGNFTAGTITANLTGNVTGALTGNASTASTAADLSANLSVAHGGTHADLSATGGTSQVVKQLSTGANFTVGQLACSDLSNGATSCSTDTTNAANISSGTLPAARLPNPSASTLGGVESITATTSNFLTDISTSGVPHKAQPACGDLSNSAASCSTDTTNASNISSGTLAIARGGTGGGSVNTAPTATNWAGWDANKNLSANNFIAGYRTTATAAGTTTLVIGDAYQQYFTGSTTQTVKLPVVATLNNGHQFQIVNNSSGTVTVQSSGANTITAIAGGQSAVFTLLDNTAGSGASSWNANYAGSAATSAAKWTTARSLAGNSVDGTADVAFANSFIVKGTSDSGLSGAQFLGALSTGIVKNTTTTGVLSIAAASDLPSVLTTKGDLSTFSTVPARVAVGGDGLSLFADSSTTTGLRWAPNSTYGTYQSKSADYTLVATDDVVLVDASGGVVNITLPAANAAVFHKYYIVKKTDSSANGVVVTRAGSDTIDGSTTKTLSNQYEAIIVASDLTSVWNVLDRYTSIRPVNQGGTGLTTLTAHDLQVGNGTSTVTQLSPGTSGQFLQSAGSSSDPAFVSLTAPTFTKITSTGTTAGYKFIITSGSATAAATYTNNGHTFTVLGTIASGTVLYTSGTLAPASTGTLTKSGGTGDSSITFSFAQPMATYTAPAGTLWLRVRLWGGGGGASTSGSASNTDGGQNSNDTIFTAGVELFRATGGFGGSASGGGSGAGGAGIATCNLFNITGGRGQDLNGGTIANVYGPLGGVAPFMAVGGGLGGTNGGGNGGNGTANTGGGGGAPGGNSAVQPGGPGGGGGYCEGTVSSPSGTYYTAVGGGGTGGTPAGTSGGTGGNGGTGFALIEEHYQ